MLSSPLLLLSPQTHFMDNPRVDILLLKIQRKLTRLPQKHVHPSVIPNIHGKFEMPVFQQ